jgi:hypothetical protein
LSVTERYNYSRILTSTRGSQDKKSVAEVQSQFGFDRKKASCSAGFASSPLLEAEVFPHAAAQFPIASPLIQAPELVSRTSWCPEISKINAPGYGFPIRLGAPGTGASVSFQEDNAGFIVELAQAGEVSSQWEISNIAVPGLAVDPDVWNSMTQLLPVNPHSAKEACALDRALVAKSARALEVALDGLPQEPQSMDSADCFILFIAAVAPLTGCVVVAVSAAGVIRYGMISNPPIMTNEETSVKPTARAFLLLAIRT